MGNCAGCAVVVVEGEGVCGMLVVHHVWGEHGGAGKPGVHWVVPIPAHFRMAVLPGYTVGSANTSPIPEWG